MSTYSTTCTIDWPFGDEPEFTATVTIDTNLPSDRCVTLDSDEVSELRLDMPYCDDAAAGVTWTIHIPEPGPTQTELDADLRDALHEHGWVVR